MFDRRRNVTLKAADVERFWSHVERDGDGCWPWKLALSADGYGRFYADASKFLSHRVAYEISVGLIPPGLVIDHLCRNRACANPAHMEPVTRYENSVVRGTGPSSVNLRKTHCKWGHPFEGYNLIVRRDGGRFCRACGLRRSHEWMARTKAEPA